jgi:hypothetical protein
MRNGLIERKRTNPSLRIEEEEEEEEDRNNETENSIEGKEIW